MVLSEREPLDVGMRLQIGVWIERNQIDCSGLWIGHVPNHLPGHIIILEPAIAKSNHLTGDIRFKDLDNNGVIDINDKTYIGDPTPDFTYGANLFLEYNLYK